MTDEAKPKDKGVWRDLTAYWILGLCTNFGYNVQIVAAHDILSRFGGLKAKYSHEGGGHDRKCNIYSAGIVLLADNLPSVAVKIIVPYLPFFNTDIFVLVSIILSATGFVTVGCARSTEVALFGVCIVSASAGLASISFMISTIPHTRNVVSTFSSGIGAAGLIGTLFYAIMAQIGVDFQTIMLCALVIPVIEALAFWVLLRRKENYADGELRKPEKDAEDIAPETLAEKIFYLKNVMKYFLPLFTIYIFQYLINQGLFELAQFKDTFITQPEQYRWYTVTYRIANFIARSTVNLVQVKKLWLMTFLQFLNLLYFLGDVMFFFTPTIVITLIIVFWEGLLSGAASVNTYFRVAHEVPPNQRKFTYGIVTQADALGVTVAGFLAMWIHNLICETPGYERPKLF